MADQPPGRVGGPLFAVALSLLAIVIGLFGSAYQDQVVSAFPFRWRGPWGPLSTPAMVFWGALLSLGLGLFFRQRADDRARADLEAATRRIESATEHIQTSVQTLPPGSFLGELADTVASNRAVVYQTLHHPAAPSTAAELSAIARKMLHALARLAYAYDDKPRVAGEPVVYTANVMDVIAPATVADWGRVAFLDRSRISEIGALLRLRADLEATAQVVPPSGEVQVAAKLLLPVPRLLPKDGGTLLALPGAPISYLDSDTTGYDDATTLGEWCRNHGDYGRGVAEQLDAYFRDGAGTEIRSFISTPLDLPGLRVGVMNIHANATCVLAGEKRYIFRALVAPMLIDLAEVVSALLAAEVAELQAAAQGATIKRDQNNV